MSGNPYDEYWQEAFECALDGEGLYHLVEQMTTEQRQSVGKSLRISQECMSQAFYTPPPSDRINAIESAWRGKLAALQREFDDYRENAETAVRKALRQPQDASLTIGEYGEVLRHDGRTTVIQ